MRAASSPPILGPPASRDAARPEAALPAGLGDAARPPATATSALPPARDSPRAGALRASGKRARAPGPRPDLRPRPPRRCPRPGEPPPGRRRRSAAPFSSETADDAVPLLLATRKRRGAPRPLTRKLLPAVFPSRPWKEEKCKRRESERARMEESHFNSSPYFWPAVPTVSGQIENTMFINKMKEQLLPTEKGCSLAPPHYPALLTVPTSVALPTGISMDSDTKPEQLTPHSQAPVTQNITVVPVQSAGLMTAGPGLVITSPSGSLVTTAASAQTFPISAPMIVSALPPGSQAALQVVPDLSKKGTTTLTEGAGGVAPKPPRGRKKKRLQESGLPEMSDPFVLTNEDDEDQHKDGKTYRCRMCSLTFYSKSEMQIHSKSHTETKPHKCPHCSKSFANSSYLAQHIRIHSGAKPYTCSYCQKAFRQLSHLQQHTRIHTGDRPYKCAHPGCEKAFTQLSNLQSHRRQHNKDKPFKCHNCHRAYTDAASLEVHLATHTVKHAKVYTCSICSRAYTSETYLMKHMRKHNIPDPQQQVVQAQAQASQQQQHFQPQGGGAAGGPSGDTNQPNPPPQCSFDLTPYKTSEHHKDICLTVSTSAIQVEHLSSS
ncbi:zinc finger protein 384 isoform X4 [Poecile atricapillus]|uniref:zinc finger protein 384 isoform X4 n=2 Tax=Paridae TaxID=9153 RepID=UPI00273A48F4|nr:zinc finger protein 384 isoform X4 [Poecile atricapillus]